MKNGSVDSTYWSCGDQCIHTSQACNGNCPNGTNVCGYDQYQRLRCSTSNSNYQTCNGTCLYLQTGKSCGGECKDGFFPCTLGKTYYNDEQVCYNDSDQSLFYFYNGYCWWKNNYWGKSKKNKQYMGPDMLDGEERTRHYQMLRKEQGRRMKNSNVNEDIEEAVEELEW